MATTVSRVRFSRVGPGCVVILLAASCGCGSTKARLATEQLLMSDAVDHAVSQIDFRPLSGRRTYVDTKYVQHAKSANVVNADYIVSSVRQQMAAAGCRLQDKPEEADVIVELRVGTLGTDGHDVVYGLPASNAVSAAASLVPNAPLIPPIPEISVARKETQLGAAKIAVFAYDRVTRRAIWQSGIARSKSTAQDVWVFGAGPFQHGTIFEGTQFAGSEIRLPSLDHDGESADEPLVSYGQMHHFPLAKRERQPAAVTVAGFQVEVPPAPAAALVAPQPASLPPASASAPVPIAGTAAGAPAEQPASLAPSTKAEFTNGEQATVTDGPP